MSPPDPAEPQKVDTLLLNRRSADRALATSVPDDNHILLRLVRSLLAVQGWMRGIAVGGAVICIWTYTLAKWGVMFLLAVQPYYRDNVELEMKQIETNRAYLKDLIAIIGDDPVAKSKLLEAAVKDVKEQNKKTLDQLRKNKETAQ